MMIRRIALVGCGAAALALAIPNCPRLRYLEVSSSGLDEQAKSTLEALGRSVEHHEAPQLGEYHDPPGGELTIVV